MRAEVGRVLAGLDEQQVAAVVAPPGPLRILAGAGTGKTRTVTHRIAYQHLTGAVPATLVLAVTHSSKAAGEMRDRLDRLGVGNVQARTFHAAALRQLRYFWRATGLPGDSRCCWTPTARARITGTCARRSAGRWGSRARTWTRPW
ncbi:UvrD-helicase domain-containing protein [Cellulomonas soli]